MTKVILQGFILVPDSVLDIVQNELLIHRRLTLEESGCLKFEVTPTESNPNKFNVYEEFVNQAGFDNHQARIKLSKWGEVTKNVERHYKVTHCP